MINCNYEGLLLQFFTSRTNFIISEVSLHCITAVFYSAAHIVGCVWQCSVRGRLFE